MNQSYGKPVVEVTVTVDYFEEEDFETLRELLEPHFRVGGGAAYEFSEAEIAKAVIEFLMPTLQTIPTALLTSALYDALKALVLKAKESGRKTILEFKIIGNEESQITGGKQYVHAYLETDNEEVLEQGLETLKELAKPEYQEKSFELESKTRQWKRRKR